MDYNRGYNVRKRQKGDAARAAPPEFEARAANRVSSIPNDAELERCRTRIDAAARQVASSFILPWHLQELKIGGFRGLQAFVDEGKFVRSMGTPFERQAYRWILQGAKSAGERLLKSAAAGKLPERTNEQIREALDAFSVEEWRNLIGEFERRDVDTLRSYLTANEEPLTKRLGQSKFNAILGRQINRSVILGLSQPLIMTCITDALHAADIRNTARLRNIERARRPSTKRSWSEVGGLNNIAESLSAQGHEVSSYKVKMMLARMEQTPFEEFDGDYNDYLFWATDPKAYAHHLRARKTRRKPRRDPDPYFSTEN